MNITKKYIKRKTYDYEKLCNSVGGMRNAVRIAASQKWIPGEYESKDFDSYVKSLWNQRVKTGFWSPAPNPSELAPDEYIEFCVYPTILALGAISLKWESINEEQKILFAESLDWFASKFRGYGEDSFFQLAEMVFMMGESNLIFFISKYISIGRELNSQLEILNRDWNEKLDKGDTLLPYGGDYKEIYFKLTRILSFM